MEPHLQRRSVKLEGSGAPMHAKNKMVEKGKMPCFQLVRLISGSERDKVWRCSQSFGYVGSFGVRKFC